MAELGNYPPEGAAVAAMSTIPGLRFTPGTVVGVEGPVPVGPEEAGAILVLASSLSDSEKAQQFWLQAAETTRVARESPGFLRFIAFSDGLIYYGIGFWRTLEEAQAYARTQSHRSAVAALYRTGSQYSHFAGLWTAATNSGRHFFCDRCGTPSLAPTEQCSSCGQPLIDGFRLQGACSVLEGAKGAVRLPPSD
jgi:hypothetical protein